MWDSRGHIFAEGGGMSGDSAWGAEAFAWMVNAAKSQPPSPLRGVIIGAVPLDEPDDRIPALEKAGCSKVTGIVVPEGSGDDAALTAPFEGASIVFIRGGDQGRYVKGWRNTKTEAGIRACFNRGGAVAGTSAGCAVLGEVTYSAENESLTPDEALADPFHADLTLVRDFLGFVPGVFFDTHFTERGRIGRFPVMLARARELFDDKRIMLGIGVDPRTAVAVGPDGAAEIRGEGTATLLRLTAESRTVLDKGKPPTVTDLRYDQLLAGTRLSLPEGRVTLRPDSVHPNPHPEFVNDTAFEDLSIDGGKPADGALGLLSILREASGPEGDRVTWKLLTGDGKLPGAIIATTAWSRGVWERLAICQRCLASQPGMVALWVGEGCTLDVTAEGIARVKADSKSSAVILDSRGVSFVGSLALENSRHKAHLEGASMHVLGPGWGFDFRRRAVAPP